MEENELSIDCPHCGHLLKVIFKKGEDTIGGN